MGWNWAKRI